MTGFIVGIVIGVLIVTLIIVLLSCWGCTCCLWAQLIERNRVNASILGLSPTITFLNSIPPMQRGYSLVPQLSSGDGPQPVTAPQRVQQYPVAASSLNAGRPDSSFQVENPKSAAVELQHRPSQDVV